MRVWIAIIGFVFVGTFSHAQEVTKNFQFIDGIYFSLESWQQNAPDLRWDQVRSNLYTNPQTFLTQVAWVVREEGSLAGDSIDLDQVWGVCLAGIPYVQIDREIARKDLATFAGLQVRGNICYYAFERSETREVWMPVYNPVTGKPFRETVVEREYHYVEERLLRFNTGENVRFTYSNFLRWIQDDEQLMQSVLDLTPDEVQEKLFKCLLIYVDRNPVFIQPRTKKP